MKKPTTRASVPADTPIPAREVQSTQGPSFKQGDRVVCVADAHGHGTQATVVAYLGGATYHVVFQDGYAAQIEVTDLQPAAPFAWERVEAGTVQRQPTRVGQQQRRGPRHHRR